MGTKYDYPEIISRMELLREEDSFDLFFDKLRNIYDINKLIDAILKEHKFHEVALLFPLASLEELAGMTRDIFEKGLIEKIRTYQNLIVDGRNRLLCCVLAGVKPKYKPLKEGISPLEYAESKNIHRRHLESYQKASYALLIDKKADGESTIKESIIDGLDEEDEIIKKALIVKEKKHLQVLAKRTGTTAEKIKQVKVINEKALEDPDIATEWEKVKKGTKSIEQVFKKAMQKPHEREIVIEKIPTLGQINDKLRKELKETKENYHGLKKAYELLENKYNTLKESLKIALQGTGIYNDLNKNKKKNPFPTPEELREAELL